MAPTKSKKTQEGGTSIPGVEDDPHPKDAEGNIQQENQEKEKTTFPDPAKQALLEALGALDPTDLKSMLEAVIHGKTDFEKSEASSSPNREKRAMEDPHQSQNMKRTDPEVVGMRGIRDCSLASPFTEDIDNYPCPKNFKFPKVAAYDGTKDPYDYVHQYNAYMNLYRAPDEMKCRAFPALLSGIARDWFNNLPPRSIYDFSILTKKFLHAHIAVRPFIKNRTHLLTIKQRSDETVLQYIKRFNGESSQIAGIDDSFLVSSFVAGLKEGRLYAKLNCKNPNTMDECLEVAFKYCQGEEANRRKRDLEKSDSKSGKKEDRDDRKRKSVWDRVAAPISERLGKKGALQDRDLIPLNRPREQVLAIMERKGIARTPRPLKGPKEKRDPKLFCKYHQDIGHDSEDCYDLIRDIDAAAMEGKIDEVIDRSQNSNPKGRREFKRNTYHDDRRNNQQQRRHPSPDGQGNRNQQPMNTVHTIAGGQISKHAAHQIAGQSDLSKRAKLSGEVTYGPSDPLPLVVNNEGLVIEAVISRSLVRRICVDTGSAVNVLYYNAFQAMKLKDSDITPVSSPLFGFAGPPVHPLGAITLNTTFGTWPKSRTLMVTYVVVKAPSAYNVIMGRPALIDLRSVVSPAHNSMKFPWGDDAVEIKGDEEVARSCYTAILSSGDQVQQVTMRDLIPEEENTWNTEDKVETIVLGEEESTVTVGSWIPDIQKAELIELLKEFADVFAWKMEDVPGLSPDLALHSLKVDPNRKPVRQKKRHFAPERIKVVDQEVKKMLQAKIVREVQYPEWLSNPVLVPKPDQTWRMCIDFTDLNKACPKDSYTSPRIDRLVDATVGFEIFGFLDAYKGYHQILMDPEDAEKTAFITETGSYCYVSMPFGLKNAGATYQRAVDKIFHKQIGKSMEVYVDDLLIKSRSLDQYMRDVREVFEVLRQTRMKLNPKKCTFGVRSGKFLGYLISKEGIRANPDKLEVLKNMPPPVCIKDVQRLTGRLAALNRFLSRSAQRALPFFKILRKATPFTWNEECQRAFEELKVHISDLPTLTSPQEGESLSIYLSTCEEAVSAVLVRNEGQVQYPIYYVSKALHGPELRYSQAEKLALALIHASRRLRSYFQTHSIVVVTDQPLKQILSKPDTSGRLAKWIVELAGYEIEFRPRVAIKAQALADFLAEEKAIEMDQQVMNRKSDEWKLYVDGSSNREGAGAGLLLISPKGEEFPYALHFKFSATNNEAEYEALISGLKLANKLGVKNLLVFSDSQLVVNHIQGEYEAKEESMKKYMEVTKLLMQEFQNIKLQQVSRTQNTRADALSKLGSNFFTRKRILIEQMENRSYETPHIISAYTGSHLDGWTGFIP